MPLKEPESCIHSELLDKGQVRLPRKIRQALHLDPGDSVSFEIVPHHDAVILRRTEATDDALHLAISDSINEWISAQDLESFQDLGPNPHETPPYRGTRIALKSLRS